MVKDPLLCLRKKMGPTMDLINGRMGSMWPKKKMKMMLFRALEKSQNKNLKKTSVQIAPVEKFKADEDKCSREVEEAFWGGISQEEAGLGFFKTSKKIKMCSWHIIHTLLEILFWYLEPYSNCASLYFFIDSSRSFVFNTSHRTDPSYHRAQGGRGNNQSPMVEEGEPDHRELLSYTKDSGCSQ